MVSSSFFRCGTGHELLYRQWEVGEKFRQPDEEQPEQICRFQPEHTCLQSVRYPESGACGTFAASQSRSGTGSRSEEHTSELQSRQYLVCRLLLEKKKKKHLKRMH